MERLIAWTLVGYRGTIDVMRAMSLRVCFGTAALLLISGCSESDGSSSTRSASGGSAAGGGGGSLTTGGSGGSGGAVGSGGQAAELVLPIERDGKYVLEFGSTLFEVDPDVGGRITRFELDGENVIAGLDVTGAEPNWGSTFWPSPQSAWDSDPESDWPPIASIDSEPYSAALDGQTIVLTSPAPNSADLARVSVVKRFSVDLAAGAIDGEFILTNEESEEQSWAAWQVTRVAPNGLTFFATGADPVYNMLDTVSSDGITWFDHPEGVPDPLPAWPDSPKFIGDAGEPWLAHVAGDILFVKTFPSIEPAQFAPGEGEVEIYAVEEYVEIEPQGPFTALPAGESLSWTVRWYLREIPADAAATVGDAALVSFAREIAQQ